MTTHHRILAPSSRRIHSLLVTILLSSFALSTFAIAPPHPDYVDAWKDIERIGRQLLTSNYYNYTPKVLNPNDCHTTQQQQQGPCTRYGAKPLTNATTTTTTDAPQRDSRIGGLQLKPRLAPNMGQFKVLVVLIRFKDHLDRELPTREYYDELFNGPGGTDVNPVGSVRQYLFDNSLGMYDVTFDVLDWFDAYDTEAKYAAGNSGLNGPAAMQEIFKPKLYHLEGLMYDFASLDSDFMGDFDHFVCVHSGVPAELGPGTDGCETNPADRIWSTGVVATPYEDAWQSADGMYYVNAFLLIGAFSSCDYQPTKHGITVHEYGHGFQIIDLYDQDSAEPKIPLGGTGVYCLYSNVYGWNHKMDHPGHMSPYSKMQAGWLTPIEITVDGYYPVQPSEISSQVYKISKNFPEGEFLLIENRQPMLWDADWPTGGILIYHVDENADGQKNRGYPGHPNWPKEHYQVAVLQADGLYQIENGESPGDEGDFWKKGMKLGPGGDGPSTDSYQSGTFKSTGIEIEILSDSSFVVLIKVSGLA